MPETPSFTHWGTISDKLGHTQRSSSHSTSNLAYHYMKGEMLEHLDKTNASPLARSDAAVAECQIINECRWHAAGRPYMKLWPGIMEALFDTRLNFSGDVVNMPFSQFSVMFPHGSQGEATTCFVMSNQGRALDPVKTCQGSDILGPVAGAAVGKEIAEMESSRGKLKMILAFLFSPNDLSPSNNKNLNMWMYLCESDQIEERLSALSNADEEWTSSSLSRANRDKMIRATLGAAMFATNQHELVMPDIDVETIYANHQGGRSKASQAIAKDKADRIIKKHKGWKIGSEIELPRPIVIGGESKEWQGGELTHGHVRSGHMRMQPCGPGNKDRKLIFLAPTVVRPDLPERSTTGYRITDRALKKKRKQSAT